ncbi:MAG TPA: HupE/UreJ family protein [Myxococcota bacterium]|nr:HupE/UreJ family protein [Myxococcota bacterium]
MTPLRVAALAAFVASVVAAGAGAHTRSASYSSWSFDADGARVELRIPLLELTRLPIDPGQDVGSGGLVAAYLADRLSLARGGVRCAPETPVAQAAPPGWAQYRWRLRCPAQGERVIESRILLEQAPSHLHFARVAADAVQERVLTEAEPRWLLDAASGSAKPSLEGTGLGGYVLLGIEHILSGYDHLAFVLALLLLASSLREVAWLVTSFTLAHSITLGLAVLGVLRPDAAAVEALIGFSIALVAAENGWLLSGRGKAVPAIATAGLCALAALAGAGIGAVPVAALLGLALFSLCHFGLLAQVARPARLRAAVAFAFGLVHGFGFAGVLAEMQLPPQRVAHALFGFNAGVELGQLGVVALVWPALRALETRSPQRAYRLVAEVGSAAICGLGLFWFLERTLA